MIFLEHVFLFFLSNLLFIENANCFTIGLPTRLTSLSASIGFGNISTHNSKKKGKKNDQSIVLSQKAKKLLKKHGNNVDAASNDYFQKSMEKSLKISKENLPSESLSEQIHEARVEATWNSVALFLPNDYAHSRGKVEPFVDRRLRCIANVINSAPAMNAVSGDIDSKKSFLLDVGCGDGSLAPYLSQSKNLEGKEEFLNYYGLDISSEMIDLARKRWSFINTKQWIIGSFPEHAKRNFEDVYTNMDFGSIIFNGSLQFFRDTTSTLKAASDMLKPGGRYVIIH